MQTINIERLRKLDYRANEAYKNLRTNIQLCGSDIKVIMLTSTTPGEGKSTVSFNLAVSLAEAGKKVIFIDADLRKSVLVGRYKINTSVKGLTHFLSGINKFEEVMYATNVENFNVVFSGPVPPNPTELLGNKVFKTLIKVLRDLYDYIIIDCPPALGMLTVNALTAANTVLVPIQCEFFALDGLSQLVYTIELIRKNLNRLLTIEGVVFTMFDSRTNLSVQVVENVKENLKQHIYNTVIPRNVRLAEAPSYGMPIIEYDPRSAGAEHYMMLADEVIENDYYR